VVDIKVSVAKFYIVEQGARVVTVRPGGIVTAMVRTTDGLAIVFGLVFQVDDMQTVKVLVRSEWCMRNMFGAQCSISSNCSFGQCF
jgi:hypothetical protein